MRDGYIKLADFGFCKQFNSNTETTRTFCGTAEYIAPEIYQYLNYSFPVDYWSLGIMIYEMIVLTTPFYHPHEIDIQNHVIHGDFQCPDNISLDLQLILTGLLRKNPFERFGINELQSSNYYLLEEIEQRKLKCPWKRSVDSFSFYDILNDSYFLFCQVPLNPSPDKCLSKSQIRLSHIDEQLLCTTLTVNKDKFRNFSFIAF
jgi:serine/threonine protein kinase